MASKSVYFFGDGKAEGHGSQKELLGGKGAGLAEMTNIGLPVPPGFTITTEICTAYMKTGKMPDHVRPEMEAALAKVEKILGQKFGDPKNPLLMSVRSGAKISMPGMMDTVLNLGLNDDSVRGLIERSGDARYAYDSYRRLIAMYGDVVMGIEAEPDPFEHALEQKRTKAGVKSDNELSAEALEELVGEYKALVKKHTGKDFPQDPWDQLLGACNAVFSSWDIPRAVTYRRLNNIPNDLGTAVNVQTMVFGNMGDDCATGVAFTRDPATGEKRFFGEYLINAQGEDVVAGTRTPQPINSSAGEDPKTTLETIMPALYKELNDIRLKLEDHLRDMQDIEFTIQSGKLWMLQTRNGKRTAPAAVRIAVEMVKEGMIDKKQAVLRVEPEQLDQLLHPMLDPKAKKDVVAKGLPASPGAATGKVVFSADEAEERGKNGEKVILCRVETSPEDVHGMAYAAGIVTSRGGMTSHAAVVARGMGRACIAGCGEAVIDYGKKTIKVRNDRVLKYNDVVTIDGSTGELMAGEVPTVEASGSKEFDELMGWVDGYRRLKVRTNADSPHDSEVARKFGAQGIGLTRTEHMFFQSDRIQAMREMILAKTEDERVKALAKIEPMQRTDFEGIFKAMDGLPVTIRLLDPPLHEFLPQEEADIKEVAAALGRTPDEVRGMNKALHEFNPMLGLRGCRLGLARPEIYEMQARAIIQAAVNVKKEGVTVLPEIMIPLVSEATELERLRKLVVETADKIFAKGDKVDYMVGTMIEIPRAAITADEVAKHADFFSFGTNDLTQMAFGISRDDCGSFLPDYVEKGVLEKEPFQVLDRNGVGKLVDMACKGGRKTKPKLKLGICGEHGGEPNSVEFCHKVGLDYVSCSPYRVPIARLAAAHAALKE